MAFGCEARVGKDTAVDYLMSQKGGVKASFAAPLYDIQVYAYKRLGLELRKDRKLLQVVGDWGRQKTPLLFVQTLLREIESKPGNVYVSDVRYPHEFLALKDRGFTMVRLTRGHRFVSADPDIASHSSENSLQEYSCEVIVSNDGTLSDMKAKLERVYSDALSQQV